MTAAPLRRNRDFILLQVSQLVSSGGSQITAIAYPLLVLSLTGSSAKAGLVAFARLLPTALFSLPAGLAADHWNRRRLMIAAHALRAVAVGTLGVLVAMDDIAFWVDDDISVGGSGADGGLGDGYLKFVNIGRHLKLPTDALSLRIGQFELDLPFSPARS